MNIEKMHCTAFKRYGEKRDGVFDSVEVHSIGAAQNTAKAVRDSMNQYSPGGIVHAVVDAEKEDYAIELLPDDNIAWADGGYGNHHSYTFEIAESDYMQYQAGSANYTVTNQEKFLADINRGYRNAVKFAALKCKQFGFNPLAKLSNGLHVLYSHDEGRRAGVSSAHVDPSHIWPKIGKTMDDFRQDVAAAMELEGEVAEEAATDKVWMGWTKRESGSADFCQTNGDRGRAYGKYQFDYRYALVPFLQFCMDFDPSHYGGFEAYIGYGAGSSKLINNNSLAAIWERACEYWPEEFEALQDTYAYQYYYLEAKRYIKNLYGINMDNHSPAVKGSLFSMAIRSGSLTGAQKFAGCDDNTADEKMINVSYATYGNKDGGRWTKAGQWGDALKALETGEYTEIAVGTPETQEPAKEEKDNWYRVRDGWANADSQTGAFHDLELAKAEADRTGYNVYDASGKKIYPETAQDAGRSILKQCTKFQQQLEKDIAAGKNWEYHNPSKYLEEQWANALKNNKRACNCALLARWALKEAGLIPQETGIFYGKLGGSISWGAGTKDAVTATCDLINIQNRTVQQLINDGTLRPGDIVTYVDIQHTNIYAGGDKWYDAGHAYCNGSGEGAIYKSWYGNGQYNGQLVGYIIRPKEDADGQKGKFKYIVQAGSFDSKSNAERKVATLKAAGFDAFVDYLDGKYKVQAGAYNDKNLADKQVERLKVAGFDAFIR